jgi:hypothetical protein
MPHRCYYYLRVPRSRTALAVRAALYKWLTGRTQGRPPPPTLVLPTNQEHPICLAVPTPSRSLLPPLSLVMSFTGPPHPPFSSLAVHAPASPFSMCGAHTPPTASTQTPLPFRLQVPPEVNNLLLRTLGSPSSNICFGNTRTFLPHPLTSPPPSPPAFLFS